MRGLYLQGKWLMKGEECLYGKRIALCTVVSILQNEFHCSPGFSRITTAQPSTTLILQ